MDLGKLTLVSIRTPHKVVAAFVEVTMVDGKARVPVEVIDKLVGPLPRGTTVTVG